MRAAGAKRAKREGSKTRKPRQQLSKEEKALRASGVLRRNIKKVMTWCINGTSVYRQTLLQQLLSTECGLSCTRCISGNTRSVRMLTHRQCAD